MAAHVQNATIDKQLGRSFTGNPASRNSAAKRNCVNRSARLVSCKGGLADGGTQSRITAMSAIHVRIGSVMGSSAPVYAPVPRFAQTVSSGSTSAAATISTRGGDYITVTAVGGSVYVRVGPGTPVAVVGAGDLIHAGDRLDFGPCPEGYTVAVIDSGL